MRADAGARSPGPRRWAAFGTVASLGFLVQAAAIALLTSAGVHVSVATAGGVLLAILHNFIWHERWTWADRRSPARVSARFVRVIGSNGLVSLAGTVAMTTLIVGLLDAPVVMGNLAAVMLVGLFNFLLLDRLVYRG